MDISEFEYSLPKELIAQHPLEEREASRLLVYNRGAGTTEHRRFHDITSYLKEGDLLVVNNSRVLPARLPGTKETGGKVDILLLEKTGPREWTCLVKGIKKGPKRTGVSVGSVRAEIRLEGGSWFIDFDCEDADGIIGRHGQMPLPAYIKRTGALDGNDFDRYQTVFARTLGSIAAPTAGFHFTERLLDRIKQMGVTVVTVTLHIGIGTFFLIKAQDVCQHSMHREAYSVAPDVWEEVSRAKGEGRRVIACGTSSVRTLESIARQNGSPRLEGNTELFIYPGYKFRVVDAMITNFHLPRSTPLLLVSALMGRDELLSCYREAIAGNYRFYSYGDAMLVL
jgi:S-adenosylmethionine:tRNA ribosyltransferase-isomerase